MHLRSGSGRWVVLGQRSSYLIHVIIIIGAILLLTAFHSFTLVTGVISGSSVASYDHGDPLGKTLQPLYTGLIQAPIHFVTPPPPTPTP